MSPRHTNALTVFLIATLVIGLLLWAIVAPEFDLATEPSSPTPEDAGAVPTVDDSARSAE